MKWVLLLLWVILPAWGSEASEEIPKECKSLMQAWLHYDELEAEIIPEREEEEEAINPLDFIKNNRYFLQYQSAKHEILQLMQQQKCLTEEEDEFSLPSNAIICNLSATLLGPSLTPFFFNTSEIVVKMNEDIRKQFLQESVSKRHKLILDTVCRKTPPEETAYFCEQIKDSHQRYQKHQKEIVGEPYTLGSFFSGKHKHHRGQPGWASGLYTLLNTGLGYASREAQHKQVYGRDSYLTDMMIWNRRFNQTNCIGQQNYSAFNWQFLDGTGTPLSTDGQAVRSDLSNWDMQAAGNFSNCNQDTFVSPFGGPTSYLP